MLVEASMFWLAGWFRIHLFGDLRRRRIKQWIGSEIPITICDIVKTWLSQGSRILSYCDITRRQRPMRALVSLTLQRRLRTNMGKMQLMGYSPQPGCSGILIGWVSGGLTLVL